MLNKGLSAAKTIEPVAVYQGQYAVDDSVIVIFYRRFASLFRHRSDVNRPH